MTVFWRYWLLQIPGWGVLVALLLLAHRYFGLSYKWALILFGAWFLKDVAIYPILKKHYQLRADEPMESMLGQHGVAEQRLHPRGYVSVRGELWLADAGEGGSVESGEEVVVEAVDGLMLRVRRAEESSTARTNRS